MKNNKGMTIVELIVCLILVSVMMIFLLNLLITVQNFSVQNQNVTDLLVNQSVVIKALEKDMNEYKLKGVSTCTAEDLSQDKRYPIVSNDYSNLYCLKLTYDNSLLEENVGYLVQYTYNYTEFESKNVVGYKRGSNQTIRESKISMDPNNYLGYVTTSCKNVSSSSCSLKITMPIFDEIGTNYDIVATYIYNSSDFNYQPGSAYGFVINEGASPTPGENPDIPDTPEDPTLSGSIRLNCSLEDPLTIPGEEVATTDEGRHLTEDDYGLSCYYRGAVENNYLVFANMCWRIVRITGNGDIKLVLYNYSSSSCTSKGDTLSFARVNNNYNSAFNSTHNKATHIGYMYSSNPDSYDYATAYANDNDSTILTFLKTWYDQKLRSYNNIIADTIWCNDKSLENPSSYTPGNVDVNYQNSKRISGDSIAPTLKCPNVGNDGKLSKFTASDNVNGNAKLKNNEKEYKIGLLTTDELAYAGGAVGYSNDSYFLWENAKTGLSESWWTLSPQRYTKEYTSSYMWGVGLFGMGDGLPIESANAVRPSIALKSTITATGSGTATDPYVVIMGNNTPSIPQLNITATKKTSGAVVASNTISDEGLNFKFTASNANGNYTIKYCKDTTNSCNPNLTATNDTSITSYNNDTGIYYIRYKIESDGNSSEVKSYTANVVATLSGILKASCLSATPKTTPGKQAAKTNEGMLKTPDDYGTSCYYRGVIENNYLVFANMCWRIVRLDGNNNIKIVLYNYNPTGAENPCAASLDGATNALARVNGNYTTAFNTNVGKNTYVGFMYSNTPDSRNYDTAHANDNDSTILTALKTWYDNNIRRYDSVLADVVWCNEKSIITDKSFNPFNVGDALATGLGTDKTYYRATKRIYNSSPNQPNPSLVCLSKLSRFTANESEYGNAKLKTGGSEYKIGLLTADEIAFAGNAASVGNDSYYLYKNAETNYWTLSPAYFAGSSAFAWHVSGTFLGTNYVSYSEGIRPSVSLKSDVTLVKGTGTSDDPFVV